MIKYVILFVASILSIDAHANGTIYALNNANACSDCHVGSGSMVTTGQRGIKAFCLAKYPTMAGAYNSSFVCAAPVATPKPTNTPTPTNTPVPTGTPTPTGTPVPTGTPTPSPTPTVSPTPRPTATPKPIVHKTVANLANTAPVIIPSESTWNIKAGSESKISIQLSDTQRDKLMLDGILPTGAVLSDMYTSEHTGLPTVDLIWTPTVDQANLMYNVVLRAKEANTKKHFLSKKPITLSIYVYESNDPIKTVIINPAIVNGKQVILGGRFVVEDETDTTVFPTNYPTATVWDISHPLTIDSELNWSITPFAFDPAQPCKAKIEIGTTVVYHQLINCK